MSKFFNSQDLNDMNIVYDDFAAGQMPVYLNQQNSLSLESTPPKKVVKKRSKSSKNRDAPEVDIAPKKRAKSATMESTQKMQIEKPRPKKVKKVKQEPEQKQQLIEPAAEPQKPAQKVRKVVKKAVKPPKLPPPKRSSTPSQQAQQDISDIEKAERRGRSPSVLGEKYAPLLGDAVQNPGQSLQFPQQNPAVQEAQAQFMQVLQQMEQESARKQQELITNAAAIVNGAVDQLRREFQDIARSQADVQADAQFLVQKPGQAVQPVQAVQNVQSGSKAAPKAHKPQNSFLQTDVSVAPDYQSYVAAKPSDQSILGHSQLNELKYSAREAQLRAQQTELRIDQFMQKMEAKIDALSHAQKTSKRANAQENDNSDSSQSAPALQETLQGLMRQMQREQEAYMQQCQLLQQQQMNELQQQMNAERERQANALAQQMAAADACLRSAELAREMHMEQARQHEAKYSTLLSAAAQQNCGDRGDISQELKWLFAAL